MISALLKKHSFDTVFDSQKVYRLMLEAMSNPTRIVDIKNQADKLFGNYPELLVVAMTLLDNEISFYACENHQLSDEIASLTLAKKEGIELADYIFICDPNDIKKAIENVKSGTLADPHKSAIVIIRDNSIPACYVTFCGPGIDGRSTIQISQIVKDTIIFRDMQNYEYPQGIDLLVISESGKLFAIPRLVQMEIE